MARKAIQNDQIVKLIVGAGQASPSPPVGPALGSKGVKSMDFCKVSLPPSLPPSPSPSLSPSLSQKRPFTKQLPNISPQEFNARTANYIPGTPIPARVTVRPDRSFHFEIRTPPTASLLLSAAGVSPIKNKLRGAGNTAGPKIKAAAAAAGATGKAAFHGASAPPGNAALGSVGKISLKHVYEIAKIKQSETRLSGVSLEAMVKSVIAQAGSIGVIVEP